MRDAFREALRKVAGSVTVVTTRGTDGSRRGVTATAVCSLSMDPPALLACINRTTWVGQLAPASGNFAVNVLTADQEEVARAFAGFSGLAGEDRFQVGRWVEGETGAPMLEGALAAFDCRLDAAIDHTTHAVLFGAVVGVGRHPGRAQALLWVDGGFAATPPPAVAQA